jgi:diguanylate cyclase (GGDEF)-like protein
MDVDAQPTRGQVNRRLGLVSLVAVALAALLCVPLSHMHAFLPGSRVAGWMLVIPFVAAELLLVRFHINGRVFHFSWVMLPFCVGLVLVAPVPLIVAYLAGLLIASARQRVRPALIGVNFGIYSLNSSIQVLVFRAISNPAHPLSLLSWLALVVTVLVRLLLDYPLFALQARLRGLEVTVDLKKMTGYAAIADSVIATVAFLSVHMILVDPKTGWLLGALGLLLGFAYRNYSRLLNTNESLERLYVSTQQIERARDHQSSIKSLLDQTVELLGADTAELTFLPTESDPAIVVVSGRDRPFEELPVEIAAQMAEERAAELVGLEDPDNPIPDDEFAGFDEGAAAQLKRQIITAPLKGPGGIAGTLRVSMNYGDSFGDSDRQLLEMFANHASVALHNSKLIEELRAEVAQREHQAMHDRLTALPNRVMFDLQTRHALDRRVDGELVSVMLVDLDRFKEVNDTLGHGHGDELLERLGDRLGMLSEGDRVTVARLGGDEFGILLRDAHSEAQVDEIAAQVKEIIETPVEIAGVVIDVGASLGLAVAPRDGDDATTLLQRADVAMYVAKAGHRGVVRYEPGADPYSSRRLSLAADLRRAVENGEIETHYQPITSLDIERPIAVEALARWNHPEHGPVPPDVFIPIAEQSGLIRDLTFLVLDDSLSQARSWRSQGFEMAVGVNLSVRCLTDDDLVARIGRHLDLAGADPASLKLEVTEGTIMADPVRAIAVLEDLHSLGVSLAIDDFGMGFSSLNQLKRMPVSQLKIDRSFVSGLPDDREDAVIVHSVIELGHNLGMEVVAEGVEDRAALEYLRSLGCDAVQGFYLSPPLPAHELLHWLRRRPQMQRPTADVH